MFLDASRRTSNHGISWEVLAHHHTGGGDRTITGGDPGENHAVGTAPHVVTNPDWFCHGELLAYGFAEHRLMPMVRKGNLVACSTLAQNERQMTKRIHMSI